jgi:hypothetical protein
MVVDVVSAEYVGGCVSAPNATLRDNVAIINERSNTRLSFTSLTFLCNLSCYGLLKIYVSNLHSMPRMLYARLVSFGMRVGLPRRGLPR